MSRAPANVWTADLTDASSSELGEIYLERARQLLSPEAVSGSDVPIVRGRVHRSWLAAQIGCSAGALSKNARLRRLLEGCDDLVRAMTSRTEQPTAGDATPHGLGGDEGWIVFTGPDCIVNGRPSAGIPLLIWNDGVDQLASDYLQYLFLNRRKRRNSCEEYAKILRLVGRLARCRGRGWDQFDDGLLISWRDEMEARDVGVERIARCLDVVFRFLAWAEGRGILDKVVGIYDPPADGPARTFPVGARRGKKQRWQAEVTAGGSRPSHSRRATPDDEQVSRLHIELAGRKTMMRDTALLMVPEGTGARLFEMLQLRTDQLPTAAQLAACFKDKRPWQVEVVRKNAQRKGERSNTLFFEVETVVACLDYVAEERQAVVDHVRGRNPTFVEPRELFISSTTGQPLRADSVTHMCGTLFRAAGIEKANIHRLRARFIVHVVLKVIAQVTGGQPSFGSLAAMKATITWKAALLAGNMSARSLLPYVNNEVSAVDNASARRGGAEGPSHGERISLDEVITMIEAGETAGAAAALRRYAQLQSA